MSSFMLSTLRTTRSQVLRAADSIGLNRILGASSWRRNRLLILCYHGVSIEDEHDWSDLYVAQEHLDRRISWLRKSGATILPLDDALKRLRDGDLPPCAVSVTFDDGMYDFHSRAMPVLTSNSVPATLYLTTYYCGRNQPVFDGVVSYLLWKGRGRRLTLPELKVSVSIPDTTADPRFANIHNEIRRHAIRQSLDTDAKHELARRIAEAMGQDFDAIVERRMFQLMSPTEVASLGSSRVSVQLHTHRHRTPRDEALFRRELEENRQAIAAFRGESSELNHFCYPSGDYVRDYADWLRSAGVEWATTCDTGLASRSSNPFFLPRFIDTGGVSEATFRAWVSGLSYGVFARRKTIPNLLSP